MASTPRPAGHARTTLKRWLPRPVRQMAGRAVDHVRALLFLLLERLLPADRATWCFCTWGNHVHTMDNVRAVFEQVRGDPSIRKVVLTRAPRPATPADGANVHFVHPESFRGMCCVARAGTVLVGYGLANLCSYGRHLTAKHHIVQLWHGIPLKRIGRLFPGEDAEWRRETPRYAAIVCSSEADREVMRQAFAPVPRVWLTGLPRNDFITGAENDLPADYRAVVAATRARLAGRRLVLYAPTWRDDAADLYAFTAAETEALERILRAHGAVLGIRGHPLARHHPASSVDEGSGWVIDLNAPPDPNLLLRLTDVLVTDYSSIYIDFLLTGRPVVHFAYDLERYLAGRGVLYSPAQAFAGPAARTFAELVTAMEGALAHPERHAAQRDRARALFHTHAGESGRAVAERIRALAAAPDPAGAAEPVAAHA